MYVVLSIKCVRCKKKTNPKTSLHSFHHLALSKTSICTSGVKDGLVHVQRRTMLAESSRGLGHVSFSDIHGVCI